ncbi:MAG TPA: transglycosylase SLT domain-containing protein [Solirubrobacteraceae bacterium]
MLFAKSPGGVVATAARVAAYRPLIDRAVAGTSIDPNLLEALVFVESAGRPQIIAGSDPADAAGLTQILAQTGQGLLRMHINLARSRKLTGQIDAIGAGTRTGRLAPLLARRAAVDDRFNPAKELAATVRYLEQAEQRFGREDLAIESYHMGIGNLQQVLSDYDGGQPVPYAQVYFDSSPDRHSSTFRLLAGFGDDSSLYYWRVLGAAQVMHLSRTDRPALSRLASLQSADDAGAAVLHPPDRTAPFANPAALAAAYQDRTLVPLPSNASALGLAFEPGFGAQAKSGGAPASLYRGLRPVALRLLIELAARVRALSGGRGELRVYSTVDDTSDQRRIGDQFTADATGWSFQIARRYVSPAQADAFQAVLDRLQSLNLIAWAREPSVIDVTVASDGTATAGRGL